ncbi:MAG TPA: MetQ/NlpA family ABC transporter substrate-binding protein [Firmicutes bacterium]|nr:MetQ/NlpA family ABC transporter substrate-binding protein [Bacillota bacterium]
MKKVLVMLLAALSIFALASCGGNDEAAENDNAESTTIKVGASVTPHAEILEAAKPLLEEQGYTLEIVEFNDYVQPNLNVDSGELDANYFQHKPYMDEFNEENDTNLVAVAAIHYEPFGLYPGKTATVEELADGASIAIPNDGTNEARALLLLQQEGLITLSEDAGLSATKVDIAENPKNLDIKEIEAAQLARSLSDVDMAVINGNYAIEAGLVVGTDAIATEDADSIAAETYANVVAVKAGNEENEAIKALVEALQSDEVKQFMEETYNGAVIPMF